LQVEEIRLLAAVGATAGAAVGDVAGGTRHPQESRPVAECVVAEYVLAGARIRNLPEERLPVDDGEQHCEGREAWLRKERDCFAVLCCREGLLACGAVPDDGIPLACNR